ncbi:3'-5' exonuclease|uniref:DNA polymerase-3 subunit epsilon n=1 Tax=Dendrosporobacter quercicolus TaxID=146817 RepID=A0A1G9Z7X7_9FIRM|nr:3'-5' exonuclease [Dendrosporobacter quercicolus]NSL48991.1 3'-5' exonuclease [Dendrosporobacter quercicolus DSM 1736]SDN16921.1 DNA polymerase-3 subunit epsilon [Dendrosporobacter quercicolus]
MRESFTAIDFETANHQSNSACQLGVAVVSDGKIVARKSWLIKPPSKVFTFSDLHGITYRMVKDQPVFADIWTEVKPYVEYQILAAHNAEFDITVLTETLDYYQLPVPELYVIDSVETARKAWPKLRNHKLSTVAAYLNIPLNHHDAASDANACAEIILRAGPANVEIYRVAAKAGPKAIDLFSGEY